MMLEQYLRDLENRLDDGQEHQLLQEWICFADGQLGDGPFAPPRRTPAPPAIDWPDIRINQAIASDEQMVLSQFKLCSDQLAEGSDRLLSVRTNYGVGIIPRFYGADAYIMPDAMNCLPNVRALSERQLRQIAAGSLPDFASGYGPHIFAVARMYREIRQQYPKIGRWIRIDHPDCQGPLDIVELLWGSTLFYALYDEPDLVHALLDNVTCFYQAFLDHWFAIMPAADTYHAYGGRLHAGSITIRDDSAMNLSPELCRQFVHPYDARILDHFRAGAIHFCGRGDHYIADMVQSNGLTAIDLSQPHLNNMARILSETVDRGINLHPVPDPGLADAGLAGHAVHRLSLA
jgi:hypothetical protein